MESEESIPLPKRKKSQSRCMSWVRRRLPILSWGRRYSRTAALADLVAGVTLGLTLVPQSIAYAALANLPVQHGLYSAFMGTMLYVVLGTVKEVSIGPTSLMALLTLQICRDLSIEYVVLLAFLSGCLVLLMGLLRLGFLVELISPAVTSGFTSATALIIAVSQLKGLLGLSFVAENVFENVTEIAAQWGRVRASDAALAAGCCTVLLLLRKLKDVRVGVKRARLRKCLWLVSISRNAIVVCSAALLAYCVHDPRDPMFKLSGRVQAGLPRLQLPAFSVVRDNATVSLLDMSRDLGVGVLMMPLVMVLANIAIAKAFCREGRVDATQEMVTLGLCNMVGALVQAMPTCGAFTRSAVSHSSGVRTPAAGLYSGIITLLALKFLTQYFYYIPKACLSSVLICAVIFMVDVSTVRRLWRQSKSELSTLVLTACVGVCWSVELAVLVGALAGLGQLLHTLMRPHIHFSLVKIAGAGSSAPSVRARPALGLLYVNAEHVCARLAAAAPARPAALLLDAGAWQLLDYAAATELENFLKKCKEVDRRVVIYNASPEVLHALERVRGVERQALRTRTPQDALPAAAASDPAESVALLDKQHEDDTNV